MHEFQDQHGVIAETPVVTVDLPADGKVTGRFNARFIRSGHCYVSTDAYRSHPGPDPDRLAYRGKEYYRVSATFDRREGVWVVRDDAISLGATPAATRVMVAALADAIGTVWTPLIDRQAEVADAAQKLTRVDDKRGKLQSELDSLNAQRAQLLRVLNGKG